MKAYQVLDDFKAKTVKGIIFLKKGQVIDALEDKADPLVKLGKLKPYHEATGPVCPTCHERAFWESVYDALHCGVCSPPAGPALVRRWIGDSEAYTRMKAAKPAVLLSLEDFRRRLQNAGNDR
jgi:hypothetical protein